MLSFFVPALILITIPSLPSFGTISICSVLFLASDFSICSDVICSYRNFMQPCNLILTARFCTLSIISALPSATFHSRYLPVLHLTMQATHLLYFLFFTSLPSAITRISSAVFKILFLMRNNQNRAFLFLVHLFKYLY